MSIGVILAGGKATRLGPLAAQLNKSLVSVGSKPQVVRLAQQLEHPGNTVRVVANPASAEQVQSVLNRCGLDVQVIIQPEPLGPVDAIHHGLENATRQHVRIVMSDTLVPDRAILGTPIETALVAPAPSERPFCVWEPEAHRWVDRVARPGEPVAVGVFCLGSGRFAYETAEKVCHKAKDEVGMSALLNELLIAPHEVEGWQDIGDVASLAQANRERFISRSFNDIILNEDGIVTKVGREVGCEGVVMSEPPAPARHLFPRVYGHGPDWYSMEYVDMPSLAELWLYWPSLPSMWTHVTDRLVDQLQHKLWPWRPNELRDGDDGTARVQAIELGDRPQRMWVDKLGERYEDDPFGNEAAIRVNGEMLTAGRTAIGILRGHLEKLVTTAPAYVGYLHGDPNFTNVMWSLPTGTFKLLDQRPEWGGPAPLGDVRYDIGKIAYSPDFSAIVHGLFELELELDSDGYLFKILPDREEETQAVEHVLRRRVPCDLTVLKAYFCLSSAPLHEGAEARALYLRGLQYVDELEDL